ncbi:MAG: hypothetical protein ACK5KP_01580 [Paludibacteraceae bacterium]
MLLFYTSPKALDEILSNALPLPSIEMRMPFSFSVFVKTSLVN